LTIFAEERQPSRPDCRFSAAVIRTEVVGTTGTHSFIDSDSAGNVTHLVDTSGVTPGQK
jgi:hypothetical protein